MKIIKPLKTDSSYDDNEPPDWDEIEEFLKSKNIQDPNDNSSYLYKKQVITDKLTCPNCGKKAKDMDVFYFRNSDMLWDLNCGTEGYVIACIDCHTKVKFYITSMS